MIKKFKAVFCFELTNGKETGRWYIDVKDKEAVFRGKTGTRVNYR